MISFGFVSPQEDGRALLSFLSCGPRRAEERDYPSCVPCGFFRNDDGLPESDCCFRVVPQPNWKKTLPRVGGPGSHTARAVLLARRMSSGNIVRWANSPQPVPIVVCRQSRWILAPRRPQTLQTKRNSRSEIRTWSGHLSTSLAGHFTLCEHR